MRSQSRREFFKAAGLASAGLVAAATPASASSASHLPDNAQLGMLYDATKCVGCKACMATS